MKLPIQLTINGFPKAQGCTFPSCARFDPLTWATLRPDMNWKLSFGP